MASLFQLANVFAMEYDPIVLISLSKGLYKVNRNTYLKK